MSTVFLLGGPQGAVPVLQESLGGVVGAQTGAGCSQLAGCAFPRRNQWDLGRLVVSAAACFDLGGVTWPLS